MWVCTTPAELQEIVPGFGVQKENGSWTRGKGRAPSPAYKQVADRIDKLVCSVESGQQLPAK